MALMRNKRRGKPSKPPRKGRRFPASRAIEPELQQGNQSQGQAREDTPASVSSNLSSDADDDQGEEIRPYNQLLQVFNVSLDRPEHRRKRRKTERTERNGNANVQNFDKQHDHENFAESEAEEADLKNSVDHEDQDLSGDETNAADPFESHFAGPEPEYLKSRIDSVSKSEWSRSVGGFGALGTAEFYKPEHAKAYESSKSSIIPSQVMKTRFVPACEQELESLSPTVLPLLPYVFGYHDVLFAARTPENASSLRSAVCLHALNHVYKTRDKVLKNNSRISAANPDTQIQYRDQGFARPKVLLILPTRNSCARYVEKIVEICRPEQQENKKRFDDDFVQRSNDGPEDRPDDFVELFEGNTDDMFRLGVKFTRKTIKFYSQFYSSDMIIASPLGLRMAIDGKDGAKKDYDFLSSIEIVVLDQTDALLMQNWEHVTYSIAHLNRSPKEARDCDFSRVRMWYLDDQAKYLRQTIVLTSYITPEIQNIFNSNMRNVEGLVKYQPPHDGALLSTGLDIKQTFSRIPAKNPLSDPDVRFTFFTSIIVPWILRLPRPPDGALGVLIFIPSYFDFVRLRNYFSGSPAVSSIAFGTLSENHTPADAEVRRARSHFLSGRHSVLLYSGRAHHFYRYLVKGVKKVVIYQLPDNPLFYKEIVSGYLRDNIAAGRMAEAEGSIRVLFSRWDFLKLERILGSERAGRMMKAEDTFEFI